MFIEDFVEVQSSDEDDDRKKRQTEAEDMDPDMQEVQSIWKDMWQSMVAGAKKIVKKVAQNFDREGEEGAQQSEYGN